MTSAEIGWIVYGAFVVIGVLVARVLYSRMLDKCAVRCVKSAYYYKKDTGHDIGCPLDDQIMSGAVLSATALIGWPLALAWVLITLKPHKGPNVRKKDAERLTTRIADLERELKIR